MSNSVAGKVILLLIDPQEDFHDTPDCEGSLAVPGSTADSIRITDMIRANKRFITEVHVTMDSHHRNHIAHAVFWEDLNQNNPKEYLNIESTEVKQGKWLPVDRSLVDYCIKYTENLESKGKYKLTIWPEHCLIGTTGHSVVTNIHDALQDWSECHMKTVNYVMKGMNCLTEMYSAIEAEVPIPTDPLTTKNDGFLRKLRGASRLIVGGQALSHCVANTIRDIVDDWEREKLDTSRIYLLRDGASPVGTFKEHADEFVHEIASKHNVTVTTCAHAFNGL